MVKRMKREKKAVFDVLMVLMLVILFVVILLVVVLSAMSYQNAVSMQEQTGNRRALLSYIHTAVMSDRAGRVEVVPLGDAEGIVIYDPESGYEQRIYQEDGILYENDGERGMQIDREESVEIGHTQSFDAAFITDSLLRVRTDQGETYISVGNERFSGGNE